MCFKLQLVAVQSELLHLTNSSPISDSISVVHLRFAASLHTALKERITAACSIHCICYVGVQGVALASSVLVCEGLHLPRRVPWSSERLVAGVAARVCCQQGSACMLETSSPRGMQHQVASRTSLDMSSTVCWITFNLRNISHTHTENALYSLLLYDKQAAV